MYDTVICIVLLLHVLYDGILCAYRSLLVGSEQREVGFSTL